MKRKIVSIVLTLLTAVQLISVPVHAADAVSEEFKHYADGKYYSQLTQALAPCTGNQADDIVRIAKSQINSSSPEYAKWCFGGYAGWCNAFVA